MSDKKCTFGTKMPIDANMLNEIILRETKHFRNYKIYRPNFGSVPVTGKFYAKHDVLMEDSTEQLKKQDNYAFNVAQARIKGPRSKYPEPMTDNQVYGWYPDPLIHLDRTDTRLYKPIKESQHTKIEVIIQKSKAPKQVQ